ncbi:MAG: hypothetical protein COV36_01875 [Alphaproteobacteria bacterium CG11_big_fil_rev_8_21_14_0_20_44_7]|nr:MAG: hypothetical protein COV36_01875 [Alphaproteobacteria bacterium CG11_big_fil_rev_8_21_14_0_20_44_7]
MWQKIKKEIDTIWQAHKKQGLSGQMCLYSIAEIEPWRSKEQGFEFWFNEADTQKAVNQAKFHYNEGKLPNTPLLLNPIVHDENKKPIGSGVAWATALALGIAKLSGKEQERLSGIGAYSDLISRSENKDAGLKIIAFSNRILKPLEDGTVEGCRELYELTDVDSEEYYKSYMLGGLSYLTKNGSFKHENLDTMLPPEPKEIDIQIVKDAAKCWNAYDRHHILFERFGVDPDNIEKNLKYFNLCARNFEFFDKTGPQREGSEENFEFVVEGLIPRGAVCVLAGAGGTGKSSIAHELCVKAGIDYAEDEKQPIWLGQPVNTKFTKGICVYFSGEDGPAVINARAKLFDPEERANRVMFQRAEFRDKDETLPEFMKRLATMPDVPIMVIDPARKYLEGDENNSEVVSEFFEAIEEFAVRKNCAMIVVHHLEKSAKPESCAEILDLLRGSQVFIDRPRVVLGLYRDGPYTVVGLAKCNIPPTLGMITEERVFARDPKSLQLIWLPGEEGVRRTTLSEEELEEIKTLREIEEARNQG